MSLKAGCSATIWIFLAGMLQQVLPVGLGVLPDGDEKAFKKKSSLHLREVPSWCLSSTVVHQVIYRPIS